MDTEILFRFKPLTIDHWDDFASLMGVDGEGGGCWCMWFRETRKEFRENQGDANRDRMKRIVATSAPTGILAYAGSIPVGWCAISPREQYPALEQSKKYKRIDAAVTWAITCFYVKKGYRRKGLMDLLIREACLLARQYRAQWVEAYPVIPTHSKLPPTSIYTGIYGTFAKAGFQEVARRAPESPIMRLDVTQEF